MIRMRKFLPHILILFVLVILFIPTHFAHAWGWPDLNPITYIVEFLSMALIQLVSWLTGIAGMFLNFVLKYTIIDMSEHLKTLTGINIAWKVVRDLINIVFIFLLVYEGIKMIIGLSDIDKIRKFVSMIVLASLLVNFSLFFTKVLIDASNIVTINIYQSILGPDANTKDYGLSDPVMKAIGLQGIWDRNGEANPASDQGVAGVLIFGIGSISILLVAAFVFFAVAIIFVVRYITLIVLLMLSPVAYMGMALPFLKKYADDWWNSLNSQLLFPPIYMIMTWVVLTLMSSDGFIPQKSFKDLLLGGGAKPQPETMGIALNFAIIIGLLVFSLIIAKSTSTKGSKYIGDATGKLTAFAGGAVMGGTARLSRATLGRAGNNWANDEALKERAAQGGFKGSVARMQLAAGNQMAKRSFDVRAVKVAGVSAGSLADFGKVDSKKENFKAIREEQTKKAEEKMKQYKPNDAAYAEAKRKDDAAKKPLEEELKSWEGVEGDRAVQARKRINKDIQRVAHYEKDLNDTYRRRVEQAATREEHGISEEEKAKIKEIQDKQAAGERTTQKEDETVRKLIEKHEKIKKEEDRLQEIKERQAAGGKITWGEQADLLGLRDWNSKEAVWRKVAGTFGTATHVVGMTSLPKTREDRKALARKMRAVPKEKTKAEKALEAMTAAAKEEAEKGGGAAGAASTTTPGPTPPPGASGGTPGATT
ncbi:MAG: hypothetical protein WC857_00625 [Candidatus Paceibacterota bacterium]|jgi:hypothetical protein